jgi:protein ImuB
VSESPDRVLALWLPEPSEDAERGPRRWAHALESLDAVVPGMAPLRIGLCAVHARGPARYYGGESEAAEALVEAAAGLGFTRARAAVASGRFAAEQAACAESVAGDRVAEDFASRVRVVAAASTAAFLAPLPVGLATDPELTEVLVGLGVRTLGAFAGLPEEAVLERFGVSGANAHRLARGLEPRRGAAPAGAPRREISTTLALEPPLDDAERLAFACRERAEAFIDELAGHGLVCTELRVELIDDIGARHERHWAHPSRFTEADVVNRVRWQAAALPEDAGRGGYGIAEVRLTPVRTARAADHEPGLWSSAPSERIHHHLTRVQGLVGYEGVGTGELLGGRLSADRQRLRPWGSPPGSAARARPRDGPWPGRLDGATPSAVYADPPPVSLLDRAGRGVRVDRDELLTADPALLLRPGATAEGPTARTASPTPSDSGAAVEAWSAPWPLREGWWTSAEEGTRSRTRFRLQLLLRNGEAWLLRYERAEPGDAWVWVAEGRYD